jgi:tetratricopeptide (TPR) repeat protein
MAFGFGFNKQKVLSTAEKFVQQGKLQNAIAEYEKILKADPKDLTVMNTVGDLYARLGQNDQAVDRFKNVGDAYAGQGFTVKAIAMYKKLSKLKPSLDSVLRLAELYTQQGLFNDARAQYLQVAEEFLRTGELEQAVRIFQKTLEMDPENVAMRTRLAEVYVRLGKKAEASQIFTNAAESLRGRGAIAAAEEILQRLLTLDPGNSQALLMRGKIAFDSGDIAGAIQYLEKVADLDSHPDGLRILLRAYTQVGRLPEAGTIAGKLISVHNDAESVLSYADALLAGGRFDDVLLVYQQFADRLLASHQAKVVDALHLLIGHVRGNAPALEILLALLIKGGESTHLTEVYELLAHACVQSGELEKARDYYHKLTQLEPQNQLHTRNYQQVVSRQEGAGASLITVEEGAVLVDELEATSPFLDQRYVSDDVALTIRAALTDAELFASYNMSAKALGPLLAVLPQAPLDLRLNQRLAALHTRAGRFAEAGGCCRTLERLYHDAGYPAEAARYGELATKYEERASLGLTVSSPIDIPLPLQREATAHSLSPRPESTAETIEAAPATDVSDAETPASPLQASEPAPAVPLARAAAAGLFWHAPPAAAVPSPAPLTAAPVSAVPSPIESEIDLSDEWEGALSDEPAASPAHKDKSSGVTEPSTATAEATGDDSKKKHEIIADTIEELRFYVAQSMIEQARSTLAKLEELQPELATLAAVRDEVEAAAARSLSSEAQAIEEVSVEDIPAAAETQTEPETTSGLQAGNDAWTGFSHQTESSPDNRSLPAAPAQVVAPVPESPAVQVAQTSSTTNQGALDEFVSDLESALGDSFLPPPAPKIDQPAPPQASLQPEPVSLPSGIALAASAAAGVSSPGAVKAAAKGPLPVANSTNLTYQPRPLASAGGASRQDLAPGVDLAGMFGELRQELEEDTSATNEDPETHYNLGVAFREMGLLDEAIGELQKVCQAVDRGHSFPQLMQAYTWLAQCFLDKGVPEAAIRWYEKALQIPDIDADTRIALHYELACSYEAAQNKPMALKHFLEVYGGNIDYRDVAERIRALKS